MSIPWILYRSRPVTAPWPATILDIARVSEDNNAEAGVTGLLIFGRDLYVQYMEGSPDAVAVIWSQIVADTRHEMLWRVDGTVDAPRFPGLPLGYYDADREHGPVEATPLWRERATWHEGQADEIIALTETIARAKYPSLLGVA